VIQAALTAVAMLTVIGCIGELDESLTDLKVKDCIEDPGEDEEIASVH
jgi:hypothetical protein